MVDVITDFTITGRLARFGRGGMIEDISKRMMRDFSQCLQATLDVRAARRRRERRPRQAAPRPQARRDARRGGRRRRRVGRRRGRGGLAASRPRGRAGRAAAARPAVQPQAAKPVHGIRLVLSVLWERVVRFFARLVGRGEK